ncbi:hypothetical protein [Caulobacter sp. 17J65-9]|uniref:hypothetical protein n=1 Tax=Caulobacter sp. 17J65-9 TaxID=2709382 RepID=UPI0013CCC4D9|nr:hypothetical protein [Caulobacter sp. 17J65-9]NEX94945.1 hypothetical protein [Caulobacter sp. 17J65-9]
MKYSARLLACLLSGVVVGSATIAAAEPVALTASEMDSATAGRRPDTVARLAAIKARIDKLSSRFGFQYQWPSTATNSNSGKGSTSSNSGKSNNVRIERSVSYVTVTHAD